MANRKWLMTDFALAIVTMRHEPFPWLYATRRHYCFLLYFSIISFIIS